MRSLIFKKCYHFTRGDPNTNFIKKMKKYQQQLSLHSKVGQIQQNQVEKYISKQSSQQITSKIIRNASYDKQLRQFVKKFNQKYKNNVTLLDLSNYSTSLGDLKNVPLKKSDLQTIHQFQKRKADSLLAQQKQKFKKKQGFQQNQKSLIKQKLVKKKDTQFSRLQIGDEGQVDCRGVTQGPFTINDNFMIFLLSHGVTTKITTLNRINSFRTLYFMGNGNGIISYGKGKGSSYQDALNNGLSLVRKNIIAIPMDHRCTLPLQIKTRFQDYRFAIRPNVGYNSWGNPILSNMISIAGIDHAGFKLNRTGRNVYNMVNVLFKALTQNTTPQQLAQHNGFKVYRHQFIRPLTFQVTHRPLSS